MQRLPCSNRSSRGLFYCTTSIDKGALVGARSSLWHRHASPDVVLAQQPCIVPEQPPRQQPLEASRKPAAAVRRTHDNTRRSHWHLTAPQTHPRIPPAADSLLLPPPPGAPPHTHGTASSYSSMHQSLPDTQSLPVRAPLTHVPKGALRCALPHTSRSTSSRLSRPRPCLSYEDQMASNLAGTK